MEASQFSRLLPDPGLVTGMSVNENPGKSDLFIVGIGASLGGVNAVQEFFQHVRPGAGIAYVVVLLLSRSHDSWLAEMLQTITKIPVILVTEKVKVLPNRIYILPSNQRLEINNGYIAVSPDTLFEDPDAPIDNCFRTLAGYYGAQVAAVILSGAGAHGAAGLRRVKECGGDAFVQSPAEAGFNEMPLRSIATDMVDKVLPVAGIPAEIIACKKSKDAERRQAEEKYRTLFNSIDEGYMLAEVIFDDDGRPVDILHLEANPAAIRMTGLDYTGLRLTEIDPAFEPYWYEIFGRVARTGKGERLERYAAPLKAWFNFYVFKPGGGDDHRVAVLFSDVTERKQREQQKDEFIGIASHELKTPLTSIKAYVEMLSLEESGDNEIIRKLDVQVDRLTGLIRTLLDTTHISEGKLPLHPEEFDLNGLITSHVEDIQRISQKHRLVFTPGDIAPVTADPERIGQVVDNLVSNAVKYSPEGGEVAITSMAVDDGVKVSVRDYGIGISAELQQKVFDRFFRVSNPQMQTFPGMGLGLYISAGIVHRHGGTISLESKLGEGSLFYFTIPYTG